jgi:hypothetical protein
MVFSESFGQKPHAEGAEFRGGRGRLGVRISQLILGFMDGSGEINELTGKVIGAAIKVSRLRTAKGSLEG